MMDGPRFLFSPQLPLLSFPDKSETRACRARKALSCALGSRRNQRQSREREGEGARKRGASIEARPPPPLPPLPSTRRGTTGYRALPIVVASLWGPTRPSATWCRRVLGIAGVGGCDRAVPNSLLLSLFLSLERNSLKIKGLLPPPMRPPPAPIPVNSRRQGTRNVEQEAPGHAEEHAKGSAGAGRTSSKKRQSEFVSSECRCRPAASFLFFASALLTLTVLSLLLLLFVLEREARFSSLARRAFARAAFASPSEPHLARFAGREVERVAKEENKNANQRPAKK